MNLYSLDVPRSSISIECKNCDFSILRPSASYCNGHALFCQWFFHFPITNPFVWFWHLKLNFDVGHFQLDFGEFSILIFLRSMFYVAGKSGCSNESDSIRLVSSFIKYLNPEIPTEMKGFKNFRKRIQASASMEWPKETNLCRYSWAQNYAHNETLKNIGIMLRIIWMEEW